MSGLLLGTSISGRGDAVRRERAAQASLAALEAAGLARCVTLDFADAPVVDAPCRRLRVLRTDARLLSGADGPRKPIVSEMLDVLAAEAARSGASRIGLVNGDIVVTADAASRASDTDLPALAFSRIDTGGGIADAPLLFGVDMFTFDLRFWQRHRARFRAYVLGDAVWDNVYAAVIACHGGRLLNREPLIFHERHPAAFHESPFARYVHLLAARDSSYFALWCAYVNRAGALREAGGSRHDEEALQAEVFHPPGYTAGALDVARAAWWRARRTLGA